MLMLRGLPQDLLIFHLELQLNDQPAYLLVKFVLIPARDSLKDIMDLLGFSFKVQLVVEPMEYSMKMIIQ
jgi:hypothetical protein